MPLDPKLEGFRNAASSLLPSDLRIEGYASLARAIAGKVDWAAFLARNGVCAEPTETAARLLRLLGRRLFRRPLSPSSWRGWRRSSTPLREGDPFPVAAGWW